jgi:uncharacterized lipoprotein YddW (UPF0748 family)
MHAPLLILLGLAGAVEPIDAFRYETDAAAQAAWTASAGTPPVEVADVDGRPVLVVKAPFAADAKMPRAVVDRDVRLDLSTSGSFELVLDCDPPRAVRHLTLYFRSGDGWYGHSATLRGRSAVFHLARRAFGTEGQPAGWDRIDGIRIAAWRAEPIDATIRLTSLSAIRHDVAVVVPRAGDQPGQGELRAAADAADRLGGMLDELGIRFDVIDEPEVARGALGRRAVAVLAYNPRLAPETIAALIEFVERGGKLFVGYALPERLADALGFAGMRYVRQERPGHFAEIRFDSDEAAAARIAALPPSVRQNSWNITAAEPDAHGARAIGLWYDDAGKPTGQAALLLSDRGAFFSHLVLADDRDGKKRMLAAVLGRLAPSLWEEMARTAIDRAARVGPFTTTAELADHVRRFARPEPAGHLDAGLRQLRESETLLEAAEHPRAVRVAAEAHGQLVEGYLRAQESPRCEGRAVWNHSGTGAYPGDWERSAEALAAAGFNMVLPNMLWAGRAHYPSDLLPRSTTYAEHGDQIAQCVEACHCHGVEVHVWKVNYNLSGAPAEFVGRLRREGRTQQDRRGEPVNWLCPSHPENLKLELDSMIEVARKYPVAGLHFDYIRYPNRESCYCDGCRERFERQSGRAVGNWPDDCYAGPRREEYHAWRCRQISALVEAVAREGRKLRPELKISAAVFGSYPDCRESVGQDWPEWIRAGWLDFVCPMNYTNDDQRFRGWLENQVKLVGGRIPVYPGIGVTLERWTLSADRVAGQIGVARSLGAEGFTLFNFGREVAESILPGVGLGATAAKAEPPHARPAPR